MELGSTIQHADWKKEKHVPVIECPNAVTADDLFEVTVSVGKELSHPNSTAHHIRWIMLYFQPKDGPFTYDVGHFEFNAHGESVTGPDEGPIHAHPSAATWLKIIQPGTLHALAYCNVHGLWETSKEIGLLA